MKRVTSCFCLAWRYRLPEGCLEWLNHSGEQTRWRYCSCEELQAWKTCFNRESGTHEILNRYFRLLIQGNYRTPNRTRLPSCSVCVTSRRHEDFFSWYSTYWLNALVLSNCHEPWGPVVMITPDLEKERRVIPSSPIISANFGTRLTMNLKRRSFSLSEYFWLWYREEMDQPILFERPDMTANSWFCFSCWIWMR